MSDYYGIDGEPIMQDEWIRTPFSDRRVAVDEFDGGRVSTVHLGLDHSYGGPPLIFETMIFDGEHDGERWRYTTLAEAKVGHARAVALVKGETA
ncbi:MAG TPA: hypothetical protein VNJ54_15175 [Plantibacter sp.]|uniref:hypothetical protein n=1 Tax=Plantibacter sp. TaxID=1871045 RepID=UPI002CD92096|nr:hypothetical protein [Plantibacter sp.]